MKRPLLVLLVVSLAGCSAGVIYPPTGAPGGGPHPHISATGAIHAGPVEVMHSAVSNSNPATDLTVATVSLGPTFGAIQPTFGMGWQWSRMWGACVDGFNCDMTWANGYAVSVGITYRRSPLRVDLRGYSFDNSPVGAHSSLPLEAVVLLFGFDL